MLIGNGARLLGGPYRGLFGANLYAVERGCWQQRGAIQNFYAGAGTISGIPTLISGLSSIANKNAFPTGYTHPYCWQPAIKAGGMSSFNYILGTSSISSGNLAGGRNIESSFSGLGFINNADINALGNIESSFSGLGFINNADINALGNIESSFSGLGFINNADINALGNIESSFSGLGFINNAALGLIVSAVATLVGEGTISNAAAGLILSAVADLAGTSSITSSIEGIGNIEGSSAGTGSLTGDLGAIAGAIASLAGTGTINSASIYAYGNITAELTPFTELSPQSLANALLTSQVEGSITMEELLRILLAVAAGKSVISGNPVHVFFRDQADTKNRVDSTMDGSERSNIDLDAS